MAPPTQIKIIVRLPYERPSDAPPDPARVDWDQEKENILWEVIARARATEGGTTDWKALSLHLKVPLPYLLHRAQVRYEQDLQGLQDIRGTFTHSLSSKNPRDGQVSDRMPTPSHLNLMVRKPSTSKSTRPLGIKQNLPRPDQAFSFSKSQPSESQAAKRDSSKPTLPTQLPSSSPDSSEDEDILEVRRAQGVKREEEQEFLTTRLKELELLFTKDRIGLVHEPRQLSRSASISSEPKSAASPLHRSLTLVHERSQTESASTSPQGSIPSIPSPTSGSQSSSQILQVPSQKTTYAHSPARSPLSSPSAYRTQPPPQRIGSFGKGKLSEKGSTQGSTASSFSDISEADISASAMESALLSNPRGAGSKLSSFARARLSSAYRAK